MIISTAVMTHLSMLLDSSDTDETVQWLAQWIITDGVEVFFPDSKARKNHLLNMISSVLVKGHHHYRSPANNMTVCVL